MTSQWQPGTSGNPQGRPKGSGEVSKIRGAISARIPEVINVLFDRAMAGDVSAARLLLERTVAPLRPQEVPLFLELPVASSLTDQGRAVLEAISQENLDPSRGSALIASIASLARVKEIDELTSRIESLEERARCQGS